MSSEHLQKEAYIYSISLVLPTLPTPFACCSSVYSLATLSYFVVKFKKNKHHFPAQNLKLSILQSGKVIASDYHNLRDFLQGNWDQDAIWTQDTKL